MDKLREEDNEMEDRVLLLLKVMHEAGNKKLRKHAVKHLLRGKH